MTADEMKTILDGMAAARTDLKAMKEAVDADRKKLDAYDVDLGYEIRRLRTKHGYDDIMDDKRRCEDRMRDLNKALVRMSFQTVADAVAVLLRSNPDEREYMLDDIRDCVEITANDNVKPGNYVACFTAFAKQMSNGTWYEAHRPQELTDGSMRVEQGMIQDWSPCMALRLTGKLTQNSFYAVPAFLDRLHGMTLDYSERWARKCMHDMDGDEDRQRALFRLLSEKYADSPSEE